MKPLFYFIYAIYFLWCYFFGGIWAFAAGILFAWPVYWSFTTLEKRLPRGAQIASWVRYLTAIIIIFYGGYLSTLTGSYTQLVLPGFGGVSIGAGTGAAIGFGTWLVFGTIGVVSGGTGFAVGALAMTLLGGGLGAAGAASSGFGRETITYPLITPWFWIPMILIGVNLLFFRKKKAEQGV